MTQISTISIIDEFIFDGKVLGLAVAKLQMATPEGVNHIFLSNAIFEQHARLSKEKKVRSLKRNKVHITVVLSLFK